MRSRYSFALSVFIGAAIGAIAGQGLQAQAKPPAYIFTEFEIIDQKALAEFSSRVAEVVKASGAKNLVRRGQIIPLEGEAPKLLTVQVFESLEKARAFRNSRLGKISPRCARRRSDSGRSSQRALPTNGLTRSDEVHHETLS